MDLELADKRVVVTGGASHIGRAIVHAFAGEQGRVVIVDLDEEKAERTRKEALDLGAGGCVVVRADLSSPEGCVGAIEDALPAFGGIDVLVNNFGWGEPRPLLESTGEYWDRLWRMNLECTVACSQRALREMKSQGRGSIVSLASDAAQGGAGPFGVYGALKAGVIALTRSIAREFGRDGVRANAVAPGVVPPEAGAAGDESVWRRTEPLSERQIEVAAATSARHRVTTSKDVAQAVVFFASEVTARQVTGQMMSVSGGWWMP
jgi:NAD(P)-dependent dehydrogenase (short-subunit alcohol dehydrogenase family)